MATGRIIEGMKEALRTAQCEHAFIMTPTQPKSKAVRVFCPRCEATFLIPKENAPAPTAGQE